MRDAGASGDAIEIRVARMESLLHRRSSYGNGLSVLSPSMSHSAPLSGPTCTPTRPNADSRRPSGNHESPAPTRSAGAALQISPPPCTSHLPTPSQFSNDVDTPLAHTQPPRSPQQLSSGASPADEEELVMPLDSANFWEHHGPGAWVSICSEPGLRWVCARTGSIDFIESAKGLISGWTKRLRFKDGSSAQRTPEPDEATAWRYCTGTLKLTCFQQVQAKCSSCSLFRALL